jgi:hypothetical protein
MTNPDDLKQRLRASYGTSCYLCGAQRPKLDDVLVLLFNPIRDTVETEDNTYLCCKTCAPKIRNRPLGAYATEQRARAVAEAARLAQIELWHGVGQRRSPLPDRRVAAKRIADDYGPEDIRDMVVALKEAGVPKWVVQPLVLEASNTDAVGVSNRAMQHLLGMFNTIPVMRST